MNYLYLQIAIVTYKFALSDEAKIERDDILINQQVSELEDRQMESKRIQHTGNAY